MDNQPTYNQEGGRLALSDRWPIGSIVNIFTGLVLTAFGGVWVFLQYDRETIPVTLLLALVISIGIICTLSVIVISRFWRIYRNSRIGMAGSRLHIRLVSILSVVAITPAIVAFILSALVLQVFVQEFFVERVENANLAVRAFANSYIDGESRDMAFELVKIAHDLRIREEAGAGLEQNVADFRAYLYGQAIIRKLSAVTLLDGDKNVLASIQIVPGEVYRLPDNDEFVVVDTGETRQGRFNYNALNPETLEIFRGLLKIEDYGGGYLVGYKHEDPIVSAQMLEVRAFTENTAAMRVRLAELRGLFTIAFGMLALIVLLAAGIAGLFVARSIVAPIGRLSAAAGRISAGDMTARVDVRQRDGELGELGKAFNNMTAQLAEQREDLLSANTQSDERRRFIETVLSGVSAGVLGVSTDGCIMIANRSAAEFLGTATIRLTGRALQDVIPEFHRLIERAKAEGGVASDQLGVSRPAGERILTVRVTRDVNVIGAAEQFVITFDDISQLIAAQRDAAWGEIAQRIAHEIKNPLTPIQLSAERLRRKYACEVRTDPEVFEQCTEAIIRHVKDIGRMVNEFSSFARMPEPVMATKNLREIIKSTIFPFQVSKPDIQYKIDFPEQDIWIICDDRLIVQACTNLIKNAAESIAERLLQSPDSPKGCINICVRAINELIKIQIIDNGKGLPLNVQHRLTEPYMTTRKKGTGLGLAIVRKVIEEHNGTLSFENSTYLGERGACVTLLMPRGVGTTFVQEDEEGAELYGD